MALFIGVDPAEINPDDWRLTGLADAAANAAMAAALHFRTLGGNGAGKLGGGLGPRGGALRPGAGRLAAPICVAGARCEAEHPAVHVPRPLAWPWPAIGPKMWPLACGRCAAGWPWRRLPGGGLVDPPRPGGPRRGWGSRPGGSTLRCARELVLRPLRAQPVTLERHPCEATGRWPAQSRRSGRGQTARAWAAAPDWLRVPLAAAAVPGPGGRGVRAAGLGLGSPARFP